MNAPQMTGFVADIDADIIVVHTTNGPLYVASHTFWSLLCEAHPNADDSVDLPLRRLQEVAL